ncbi:MAG: M23 family metallopeptidase, partial [Oscillospiraceae bacterium]
NTPYDGPPSTGQFIWPVTGGYISQYFSRYHVAIDYAGRGNIYGKPIYAADDGRVVFAGSAGSYGLLIKVDHGNGLMTWYAHCSDISPVSVGKNVKQGEIIGKVGATGNARGAHLHFEVTEYGVKKNPLNYLP